MIQRCFIGNNFLIDSVFGIWNGKGNQLQAEIDLLKEIMISKRKVERIKYISRKEWN